MATDLERKAPTAKYQSFIDQQLARTRRRIRMFDVGGALLMLVVAVLGYALLMAVLDLAFELPLAVRVVGLIFGAGLAAYLLMLTLVRLGRRISLHYAARELEKTVPDAKNSVINWIDLQGEELPPAIRTALSHRAAKDLKRSDAEQAVSGVFQWILTGIAVVMAFALLVMLFMGPAQFGSLMSRAFTPFREIGIATRTQITLIAPEQGHANVPLNQRVDIRVRIDGPTGQVNTPRAPHVHFRYSEKDEAVLLPLEQDLDGNWAMIIQPDQVQNGFLYRVTAGDDETPEYRVSVYTIPQVLSWEITYKYRDYRRLADLTIKYPDNHGGLPEIRGVQGTQVTVLARTNRELKDGQMEMHFGNASQGVLGEAVLDDVKARLFKFTLESSGTFKLNFTAREDKQFETREYDITAADDRSPIVRLTKPGKDIELPANGTLALEGDARDDFGIKQLVLSLRVVGDNTELEPKVYRPGKNFQFTNRTYPDFLEYKEVVALESLKTVGGKAFPLSKGMVLEYRLLARDNFDYPSSNLGTSEAFKVTILDPEKEQQKQQQERKQAEKDRQQHEQDQDKKLKQENDRRTPPPDPKLEKQSEDLQEKKKKLDEAIKQNEDKQPPEQKKEEHGQAKSGNDQQEGKPDEKKSDQKPGESSPDAGSSQTKDAKGGMEEQSGQNKEGGMNDSGAAQAKDGGQKQEDKQADGSQPQNNQQKSGQQKSGEQGTAKDGGQGDPKSGQEPAGARDGGKQKPDAGPKGSAEKNQSAGKSGDDKNAGAAKAGPDNAQKEPAGTRPEGGKQEEVAQGKEANEGQMPQDGGNAKPSDQGDPAKEAKASSKDQTGKAEPRSNAKDGAGEQTAAAKQEQGRDPAGSGDADGQKQTQNQPQPAQAKGQKSPGVQKGRGDDKHTGSEPQAVAKEDKSKNAEGSGTAKEAAPKQAEERSEARGDTPMAEPKEATAEDVAKLDKDLQGTPEQRREAEEKLRRILEEAKDGGVREKAGDTLHDRNLAPAKAKGNEGQADPETQGQPKNQDPQMKEPGNKQGDARGEGQSPDGKPADPASGKSAKDQPPVKDPQFREAEAKGGNKAGHFGPGGQGIEDELSGTGPNEDFGRRIGDLNLDKLKGKINDDVLRKAGMTREQWEQFQRDVAQYDKLLRKHQENAEKLIPGQGVSQLSSRPLQQLEGLPNAPVDPLQINRTAPPPEFRESQRIFTGKQK